MVTCAVIFRDFDQDFVKINGCDQFKRMFRKLEMLQIEIMISHDPKGFRVEILWGMLIISLFVLTMAHSNSDLEKTIIFQCQWANQSFFMYQTSLLVSFFSLIFIPHV